MTWNAHGCRSLCWGYLCPTLQLLHHCHGPCHELSAYWHILRMHSCLFEAQTYRGTMIVKEHRSKVHTIHWK
jgi:hypothetical protein